MNIELKPSEIIQILMLIQQRGDYLLKLPKSNNVDQQLKQLEELRDKLLNLA